MKSSILMAGGLSSRMGEPKAMLRWHGQSLIQYQISQLRAGGSEEIIVVLGYRSDEIRRHLHGIGARIISNPLYYTGRASTLRIGAKAVNSTATAIMVLNVDQPRTAQLIRALYEAQLSNNTGATRPIYKTQRGHPIVIDGKLRHLLISANETNLGLKGVLKQIPEIGEIETDDSCLIDLNTPEQYQKALDENTKS